MHLCSLMPRLQPLRIHPARVCVLRHGPSQVLAAARENESGRSSSSPIAPLIAAVSSLAPQPVFVRDIHACINEENLIQVCLARGPHPGVWRTSSTCARQEEDLVQVYGEPRPGVLGVAPATDHPVHPAFVWWVGRSKTLEGKSTPVCFDTPSSCSGGVGHHNVIHS